MKPRVFIVQPVPPQAVERLRERAEVDMFPRLDRRATREEIAAGAGSAEYLFALGENILDAAIIEGAGRLRLIAGMEIFPLSIDLDAATRRGIPVTGLPPSGLITETTAEFTFALMIATAWRIPEADRLLRAGGWRQYQTRTLPALRLSGRSLGIVGLGSVGRGLARLAAAAGMRVLYTDRERLDGRVEVGAGAEWREMPALFAEADIVALTLTLTEESRDLIGAELISLMKPDALLINTSRGLVLDESALADALERGAIRGAGLDVYRRELPLSDHGPDPRLLHCENVVLTPHIGSSAEDTRAWMADRVVDNIFAHLDGRELANVLNPEVFGLPPITRDRIG